MRIPFTSRGEIINTWQILLTNNTLNVALLIGVVFLALLLIGGSDAAAYVALPIMYVSGALTFVLPVALLLLIYWRTRRAGAAILYITASLWLIWLWLFACLSLYQNAGKWWAATGVFASFVSSGFGMFAVFAFLSVMAGQWKVALIIVGAVVLCRVGSNAGKRFMGMRPSQKLRRWVMDYDPILYDDETPSEPLPPSEPAYASESLKDSLTDDDRP